MRLPLLLLLAALAAPLGASAACPVGEVLVGSGCMTYEEAQRAANTVLRSVNEGTIDEKTKNQLQNRMTSLPASKAEPLAKDITTASALATKALNEQYRGISSASWYQQCVQHCASCEQVEQQCSQAAAMIQP